MTWYEWNLPLGHTVLLFWKRYKCWPLGYANEKQKEKTPYCTVESFRSRGFEELSWPAKRWLWNRRELHPWTQSFNWRNSPWQTVFVLVGKCMFIQAVCSQVSRAWELSDGGRSLDKNYTSIDKAQPRSLKHGII